MPAGVPSSPEQRILEVAATLPSHAAVTGWAACRLHGGSFFDGLGRDGRTPVPLPVVIGPGGGTRPAPGILLSRERLEPGEVTTRHGIRCAVATRAVFDAVRTAADGREAVVNLDMALAGGVVSRAEMDAYVGTRGGWRGVHQVRAALRLASERSRSPAETRLRLIWVLDAGLPQPLVNWPIADRGQRFLAEVDLLDATLGLVGEYDGAHHRSGAQHTRDVRREDSLRREGLEYVTVTGRDLVRPALVVERILAARERALLTPRQRRTFLIKVVPRKAPGGPF